ncbi:hypothetical protein JCM8115_004796 [Rhodotorula mucilaginosa]|uniref:XLF-like N-terminal domain-containing protein n=1 Tax=Rhodotorula mucilaginosa TaxID=5537 RepID=A0A9P6VZ95_RHOMI|nr:hypothetical protein C6P46_006070 [Rhodotorula mucilaginosa]TKA58336.1 hypothetical protein B0A53_00074 [Rhodotorula sp. CCFEE 5036]
MEWDKLNRKFLPVPWASFPSDDGPLLVKLLYLPAQNNLAIMATDLQHVYYESLNSRQTNRRFEDALLASKAAGETQSQSQTQSQDVMVGIGAEGEKLLQTLVEELVGSVTSGTAKGRITHAAFEDIVYLTTPSGLEIRFLTTSLETASAATLASHLVSPLLGICSGLLSLLREDSADQEDTLATLYKRIEGAIDASGTAERIKEGRAAETFARVGGPALLGRWIQHTLGVREKDLVPVSLSLPSRPPRLFSPLPPSDSRSAVPAPASPPAAGTRTPHRRSSPVPPSAALTPPSAQQQPRSLGQGTTTNSSPSVARRMLDHRMQKGERIEFDSLDPDSHSQHQKQPDFIAVDGGGIALQQQEGRGMVDDDRADKSTDEPSTEEGEDDDPDNTGGGGGDLPKREPEGGEEGEDSGKVEAAKAAQEEEEAEEAKRKAKSAEREAEEARRRRERLQRLASSMQDGGGGGGAAPATVKKKKKRL